MLTHRTISNPALTRREPVRAYWSNEGYGRVEKQRKEKFDESHHSEDDDGANETQERDRPVQRNTAF